MGKCLAHVSERPPAKELLLDPFLATELPTTPLSTNQTVNLNNSTAEVANENLSLGDPTMSRDMTITGSMNEEDRTIFLKVQISDEIGVHTISS